MCCFAIADFESNFTKAGSIQKVATPKTRIIISQRPLRLSIFCSFIQRCRNLIFHDANVDAVGDFKSDELFGDTLDLAEDAARGDDVVAALKSGQKRLMFLLTLRLRTDDKKIKNRE